MVRSHNKSVRRRSQDLGIARESIRTILTDDPKLHPCRIQVKQKLTSSYAERVEMCEWITDMIVPYFLTDIWFLDEAHFYLSGHVNWKNSFIMPTVWNSLPATLRGMPTLPVFKAELKTYFFPRGLPIELDGCMYITCRFVIFCS